MVSKIEPEQSNASSVLADSSLVIGFQILSLVLGVMALAIAARTVSKEDFGLFVLLSVAGVVLSLCFDFGLQDATVRFVASETMGQLHLVHSIAKFRLVVAACVAAATPIGASALAWFGLRGLDGWTGLLVGMCFLGEYLATFTTSALQGLRRFRLLAAFLLADSLGRLALAVVLLGVLQTGLPGLVAIMVLPRVVASLVVLLRLRFRLSVAPLHVRMREVLRFGIPLQAGTIVALVSDKAAVVILAWLMGPASVASYRPRLQAAGAREDRVRSLQTSLLSADVR